MRSVSLLFALVAVSATLFAEQASAEKPNIVVIVGDDMGYADVGFHGCTDIPTPHLDKLAASGVKFTSGYVSGPYCSPTRAGLLTGRYQTRFGHEFNPAGGEAGLPLSEKTIADRLKGAGYKTALIGKWHLGGKPDQHPQARGFEEFFGFLGGAHDYFSDNGILRGREQIEEPAYLTDAFGREAEAFIEKNKSNPFFLYLAFNAVHTPMQADDARLKKFDIADKTRRTYAAMMSAMDDSIGRVIAKLESANLTKNTLVMFISDNGGPTMPGVTINGSVNKPFRGSKRTTLEGGVRVPFVISWPGTIQPATFDTPVIQLDLHATSLAVAGVKATEDMQLEGVNLLPHVQGETKKPPHDALYWRFGQQMAIRAGNYKLVRYDTTADLDDKPKTTSPAKLYDLSANPSETTDLAEKMPEKVKELQGLWDKWNEKNVKPLWGAGAAGKGEGKKKKQQDD
ncbi:sulfatase [Anatilimnocola floriformis]|uniref:sulfatase n=1 Tax=Anatilimnocola floriformis TaxID=2948575 RepID=UPI0020C3CC63|nr:sulfatase [Anatilimnocola floriformis]